MKIELSSTKLKLKKLLPGCLITQHTSRGSVRMAIALQITSMFDGEVYEMTIVENGYVGTWMLFTKDIGITWKVESHAPLE